MCVLRRHHRPGKRSFEDEGSEEQRGALSSSKARRLITSARRSGAAAPAHVPVTPSVITGLRSLYPAMNEQVGTAAWVYSVNTSATLRMPSLLTAQPLSCQV